MKKVSHTDSGALTGRQQDVLAFVRRYSEQHGRPPLLREIAKALGVQSYRSLTKYIRALRERGLLERGRGWRNHRPLGEVLTIPLLGAIRAGRPQAEMAEAVPMRVPREALEGVRRTEHLYLLRVSGDSMAPRFEPGDLVLVDRIQSPRDGDVVVALVDGTDNTLKTLRRSRGGEWVLVAENPAYAPIVAKDMQRLQVQGVVLKKLRIGN